MSGCRSFVAATAFLRFGLRLGFVAAVTRARRGWYVASLLYAVMGGLAHAAMAPGAVTLHGVISSRQPIIRLEAVERNRANVLAVSADKGGAWIFPGRISPRTGRFTVPGLPPGHTYDLILWTHGSRAGGGGARSPLSRHPQISGRFDNTGQGGQQRWEGVNMRYYRLVPPAAGMTTADLTQIVTFIEKIPRFTNYNRPLWIAGNHNYATVAVEQIRSRRFYSGRPGSIIFRVAIWYFQRYYSGWAKVNNLGKVMTRWRGPADKIPNPWQYLPALGGIRIKANGACRSIRVTLPQPSPHHGLAGPIPSGH